MAFPSGEGKLVQSAEMEVDASALNVSLHLRPSLVIRLLFTPFDNAIFINKT